MSKTKDYRFFNIPNECILKDYGVAVKCITRKYSGINGLLSIYNWGDPSVPGISDLDIVFVFKSSANSALPFLNRGFYFQNAKIRYLARHPFIFVDEGSFKDIMCIYPDTEFKLLYGKNIKINSLSPDDWRDSKAALLNDLSIRHYPRDFLEQLVNRKINVRDTLLRLNSLKYSVKAVETLTKEKNNGWNDRLKMIENLRKNWLKERNFDLLVSLNEDAVHISMGIIEKFRNFLTKNNLVRVSSGNDVMYNGIKNMSVFIRNWGKGRALQEMIKNIKNRQKFCSVLPLELSVQLIEYSKHNGLISSYIRKNISGDLDYRMEYGNILENRIRILDKQAELAFKLRHSDFAAFFDFGYRNKSGINNWVLGLLDKIRS